LYAKIESIDAQIDHSSGQIRSKLGGKETKPAGHKSPGMIDQDEQVYSGQ
jgi:hypothetical protein